MNCQVVQNKILAEPDPRLLPERLRLHVAECEDAALGGSAARLEALVERMPAPSAPSGKMAALVGKLERGEPIIARAGRGSGGADLATRLAHGGVGGVRAEQCARHWRPRGGCARRLGCLGALPRNGPKPEMVAIPDDPFLKKMVERNLELAKADSVGSACRYCQEWPMTSRRRPAVWPASPAPRISATSRGGTTKW